MLGVRAGKQPIVENILEFLGLQAAEGGGDARMADVDDVDDDGNDVGGDDDNEEDDEEEEEEEEEEEVSRTPLEPQGG